MKVKYEQNAICWFIRNLTTYIPYLATALVWAHMQSSDQETLIWDFRISMGFRQVRVGRPHLSAWLWPREPVGRAGLGVIKWWTTETPGKEAGHPTSDQLLCDGKDSCSCFRTPVTTGGPRDPEPLNWWPKSKATKTKHLENSEYYACHYTKLFLSFFPFFLF